MLSNHYLIKQYHYCSLKTLLCVPHIRSKVCDCLVHPVGSGDAKLLYNRCKRGGCDVTHFFGSISRFIFVPGTTTAISFALLILGAVTWASGFAFYYRYMCPKRLCG